MGKKFIHWLTVKSSKVFDAFSPKNYTWRMVAVPKPTPEKPFPCILVSLRTGAGKVLLRFPDLAAYQDFFALSEADEAALGKALNEAHQEANRIEEDMRLLFHKRHLADSGKIVRTDTGEIIAEAERILKENDGDAGQN